MDCPIKNRWLSIVMLVYQRVPKWHSLDIWAASFPIQFPHESGRSSEQQFHRRTNRCRSQSTCDGAVAAPLKSHTCWGDWLAIIGKRLQDFHTVGVTNRGSLRQFPQINPLRLRCIDALQKIVCLTYSFHSEVLNPSFEHNTMTPTW